jgi:hypothetical protein
VAESGAYATFGTLLLYLFAGLLLALLAAAVLHGLRLLLGLTRVARPDDEAAGEGAAPGSGDRGSADDQTDGQADSWQHAEQEHADGEHEWAAAASPQQVPWWDVLGVSRYAEMDDIRARYRELIRQHHPDRMIGLGPEIMAMAEAMTKALNGAIAEAREERATLRQAEAGEFGTMQG